MARFTVCLRSLRSPRGPN